MKYPWQDSGHAVKFVANYPHAAGNTEGAGRKMSSELALRLSCHGCTTVGGHAIRGPYMPGSNGVSS